MENQRKISLLLKMCGKKESEIVDMIERSTSISDDDVKKGMRYEPSTRSLVASLI